MDKYSFINVTEQVVERYLDQIIAEENGCACDKCRLDAKALALNKLPPKYTVSERGNAFESYRVNITQNRVDIYQAILEAVRRVKASPQHETEKS